MKKLTLLFALLISILLVKGQVYQAMPQYGYGPVKRFDIDSTLTIPTVCGVPTLKSNITRKSAIAFDTCNNRFYFYNSKTLVWDTIKGGGGTGQAYVDSLRRSSDSVYALKNGTWRFQYRDSVGGGTGSDTAKVVVAFVTNAEGNQLQRGEVVYIFSATGNRASVKRANNKSDTTSARTFGIVRDPISAGGTGYVTTQGQVDKLNLGTYTEGQIVYLDSVAGKFTATKPQAPLHGVFIGVVERANNGSGILYVKPQNGYEIDEIHDVQITSVANNNVLLYNDTTKVWRNRPYNLQSLLNAGNIAQNSAIGLNDGLNFSAWSNNGGNGPYFTMQESGSFTNIIYPSYLTQYNNSLNNKAKTLILGYNNTINEYSLSWSKPNASNVGYQKLLLPRYQTNQTQNHSYYLPDVNTGASQINLVSSVNGNTADAYGNVTISAGGSTGTNGLNGTTNIGLGGTLTQSTTINGGNYNLNLGTAQNFINILRLNGTQVQMEALSPRHTNDPSRTVVMVMDTVNNNTIRTIPLNTISATGRVLRGKFSSVYNDIMIPPGYDFSWTIIENTTGVQWSMYPSGNGTWRICDNCVDPNFDEDTFNDCTWYGGVMFQPYVQGNELTGQLFNINKHEAGIRVYDEAGQGQEGVINACFEIRFYSQNQCQPNQGPTNQPN